MAVLQDVNINVYAQPSEKRVRTFLALSQNENGRRICFRILGAPLPSNCSATFSGTKPDGTVYTTTGTVTGNFVIVQEDMQMTAVPGVWDANLDVVSGTHNIVTAIIRVMVERGTVAPGSVPSNSQLDGYVAQCKNYAEQARTEAYGSPLTVATKSEMTDKTRVYVYTGSEANMTAGNWYYWNGSAWTSGGVYNAVAVQTDKTLTVQDKAADGKATGDALDALKEDLKQTEDEIIETAGVIEELECGLTEEVKTALLACFEQVAWIGADGQTYYDALETALNKKRSLSSISAVFTQGSTVIYDTDELYALKQYLTVTATYDDGSTKEVNNYTLSGKLVAGTSTITVAYNKKTTTFNVTITHQAKTIESISATFSSSAVITTDNVLDDLRPYLTVRATYSDGTTNTVTNYTLIGSLNVGTNTITVTYSGKIATFTVNVTQAEKTLQSISAVFNQGSAVIYTDSALNDLKPYLTVTASYSDSTTQTVTDYALSGTLTEGTSIITASYGGKTATFNVTVSPVVTPKRYIAQGDIASHVGIDTITVANGTIGESNPATFSGVIFDQAITKMWFTLHTHQDSRRRPRYIFRKDADGSFYAIDENTTSPKLYKFTLDAGGTKYNATQISDISSVTTFTKTGDYFSTLKKEMNISNGILTITDADSSVSFTNANCFGYWQSAYNSNIVAGMFDECEVEADE